MVNILPENVLDFVAVDLFEELPVGSGGVNYILDVLDVFSKCIKLYPIKRANEIVLTIKIVNEYIGAVGRSIVILSDHGSQFQSRV